MKNTFLFVIVIISGLIEFIVCKSTKERVLMYILPTLFFAIAIILISVTKILPLEGMRGLAYIVIGIICMIVGVSSAIVAIVFEIIRKKKR